MLVPYDSAYERGGLLVARRLSPLELSDGRAVVVFDAQLSSGAKVVLLGMPAGVDEKLHSTCVPNAGVLKTAVTFARAVAAYVEQRAEQSHPVDVVHLFDWTTALAGLAIRTLSPSAHCSVVLSVRDVNHTGIATSALATELGDSLLLADETRLENDICLLKAGVRSGDVVVAPSDGVVRSFTSGTVEPRLKDVFASLRSPVLAIPGGIDYAKINPAVNPCLLTRYDAEDARNKAANKTDWLRRAGLSLEPRPLVVIPGPFTADNGAEMLLAALDSLVEMELSLGLLATSADDEAFSRALCSKAESRAADVKFVELTNDEQIHRSFAAADFVVYPKRDGIGSLCHLAAQRYGAVVIADAASTIGESVVDVDAGLVTGIGFLFSDASPVGLTGAVARALTAYSSEKFELLRRRCMRQDSSWDRPARRLIRLYQKLRNGGVSVYPQAG
jgi:glycogen synthase